MDTARRSAAEGLRVNAALRPAPKDAPVEWPCVECGHPKAWHRFSRCGRVMVDPNPTPSMAQFNGPVVASTINPFFLDCSCPVFR